MKHIKTLEPGNGYWLCETDGGTIGRVANDDIARDIIIACNEYDRLVAERDALLAVLKDAHDAISSLPQGCMGDGRDGQLVWPIRDEVLDKIAHALALVRVDDER